MIIPNYQDIKYQDFRYSDELSNLGRYEHVSSMSLEHKSDLPLGKIVRYTKSIGRSIELSLKPVENQLGQMKAQGYVGLPKAYMAGPLGASIGEMISVDGATIVGGAGRREAVGISKVEVVGDDDPDGEDNRDATLLLHLATIASLGADDTCLSGNSVSDTKSFEHRKGEIVGATGTGGCEPSDGPDIDDE
nr:hypothetical protein [Tanacetum cinerariifolium]